MIDSVLMNVELNFNDLLNVKFLAGPVTCERGMIYKEKNLQKNDDDVCYLTLFANEKRIMLRSGVFYLVFKVVEGDLQNFKGHYKITFNGAEGTADIG